MFWLILPLFAFAADCSYEPQILARKNGGFTAAWRLVNTPELQIPYAGYDLHGYRAWVKSNTKLDALALVENSLHVARKIKSRLTSGDPFAKSLENDERNLRLVLDGRSGEIHPLTCLESLPFRRLARWVDLRTKPVEFFATLLGKGSELILIADYYHRSYTGASESSTGQANRRKLQNSGWKLIAHFHNHPFNFKNEYGDLGGTLVPSGPDIASYQAGRPGSAWITNGIETIVFSPRAYSRFRP